MFSDPSIYHHSTYNHDKDKTNPLSLLTSSELASSFSNGMYTPPTIRSPISIGNSGSSSSGLASSASSIYGSVYNDSTVSLVPYTGSGYTSMSSSYMSTSSGGWGGRNDTPSPEPPSTSGSGHGYDSSNAGTIRGGKLINLGDDNLGASLQRSNTMNGKTPTSSNPVWPSLLDQEVPAGFSKGENCDKNFWKVSVDSKRPEGKEGRGSTSSTQDTTSLTPPPPFRPAMTALPLDSSKRPNTANSYFSTHPNSMQSPGSMAGDPVKETDYWPPAESHSMQASPSTVTVVNMNAAVSLNQQYQQQQLLEYTGSSGGSEKNNQQMVVVDPGAYHGLLEQPLVQGPAPPQVILKRDETEVLEGLKKLVMDNAKYLNQPDRQLREDEAYELKIVTFQRPTSRERSASREYRAGVVKSPKIVPTPNVAPAHDALDFVLTAVDCFLMYIYLLLGLISPEVVAQTQKNKMYTGPKPDFISSLVAVGHWAEGRDDAMKTLLDVVEEMVGEKLVKDHAWVS